MNDSILLIKVGINHECSFELEMLKKSQGFNLRKEKVELN